MTKKSCGVIYILTNPSFPEYVKIGYADDIERRLRQLNRSETIPYAFRVYAVYEVDNRLTDKKLHDLIDTLNPDLRAIDSFDGKKRVKEFYAMSAEDAFSILGAIAEISGTRQRLKRLTPEGHEVVDEQVAEEVRQEARRPRFKFSMIGLTAGDKVYFTEDESIVATVVDDAHIEYGGEVTSLSRLAQELKGFDHPVQGTLWFAAEAGGRNLNELRAHAELDRQ